MLRKIDYLITKICENLPLNLAIFEKDGFCKMPNKYCEYCKNNDTAYLCYKQTKILREIRAI